jgi:predicted O-methyltransferase YrrM
VEFTKDWTTGKLPLWQSALSPPNHDIRQILEVGTYEGRTATAFLDMAPDAEIVCIDNFAEPGTEQRFDCNLSAYTHRVEKIKALSVNALYYLKRANRRFDLIYIDADKDRAGVFVTSSLAFSLLNIGGIIMWDDLSWRKGERGDANRPEAGIRLFVNAFKGCLNMIHYDRAGAKRWRNQVIAQKVREWPAWAKG